GAGQGQVRGWQGQEPPRQARHGSLGRHQSRRRRADAGSSGARGRASPKEEPELRADPQHDRLDPGSAQELQQPGIELRAFAQAVKRSKERTKDNQDTNKFIKEGDEPRQAEEEAAKAAPPAPAPAAAPAGGDAAKPDAKGAAPAGGGAAPKK